MHLGLRENVPLKDHTTFRVGGPARFFTTALDLPALTAALDLAAQRRLPVLILGGGSNLLVADEGFPGLVIKMQLTGIAFADRGDHEQVIACAGENWDDLVATVAARGLHGLENLSWIPGSVGAAPVQNIGAYGAEVKDRLAWVEALDRQTRTVVRLSAADCRFSYRDSLFKQTEGKNYIILRVAFDLPKQAAPTRSYKDLAAYFADRAIVQPTLAEVRDAVIAIRTQKLPDPRAEGTAGSFFKNPVIDVERYRRLVQRYPGLPCYPMDDRRVKIPAAWVLDNVCGFRGYRKGDVGVHQSQALVLVNYGSATAAELRALADAMIARVREATGIDLEPEVCMV